MKYIIFLKAVLVIDVIPTFIMTGKAMTIKEQQVDSFFIFNDVAKEKIDILVVYRG